jgi:hypothetical protein
VKIEHDDAKICVFLMMKMQYMAADTQSIALLMTSGAIFMKLITLPVPISSSVRIVKNVNADRPAAFWIFGFILRERNICPMMYRRPI